MARPKIDFDVSLANDIYTELLRFADDQDTVPNMRAFWRYMTTAPDHPHCKGLGYQIPFSKFRYHWNELLIRQMITTEPLTGAVKVRDVKILISLD